MVQTAFLEDIGAVRTKGERHNLVTDTDEAVERLAAADLLFAHPDDGLIGEEGTSDRPSRTGYTWAIDPIDGTWNFANGIPHWCVVIACADAQGPALGVIADPMRGETWTAMRGDGMLLNGEPVPRRPTLDDPHGVTWALSLGAAFAEPRWQRLRGRLGPVRISGSLALDLAWTAAGRLGAMAYTCDASPWDVWAGAVMGLEQGLAVHHEPDAELYALMPQSWWDRLELGRS